MYWNGLKHLENRNSGGDKGTNTTEIICLHGVCVHMFRTEHGRTHNSKKTHGRVDTVWGSWMGKNHSNVSIGDHSLGGGYCNLFSLKNVPI